MRGRRKESILMTTLFFLHSTLRNCNISTMGSGFLKGVAQLQYL